MVLPFFCLTIDGPTLYSSQIEPIEIQVLLESGCKYQEAGGQSGERVSIFSLPRPLALHPSPSLHTRTSFFFILPQSSAYLSTQRTYFNHYFKSALDSSQVPVCFFFLLYIITIKLGVQPTGDNANTESTTTNVYHDSY